MDYNYQTISEAVNGLIARGYTANFDIHAEKEVVICDKSAVCLSPDEFTVDEIYRFEGPTGPADEAVVYALSSPEYHLKGVLIDAFGPYSDANTAKVIQMLNKRIKNS